MNKSTVEELTSKLQQFGLLEKQALDTARNLPLATQFIDFIQPTPNTATSPIDKSKATLLLRWSTAVVSKLKDKSTERKHIGAHHILNGNLSSPAQVDAALELLSVGDGPVDEEILKQECGVGVSMTKQEVKFIVLDYVRSSEKAQELKWAWLGKTTGELKKLQVLKWCNPIDLKTSVDESFLELFGPKDAQPAPTPSSKPTTTASSKSKNPTAASDQISAAPSFSKELSSAAEPSIFEIRHWFRNTSKLPVAKLSPVSLLNLTASLQHSSLLGFLHIGRKKLKAYFRLGSKHSKAIAINFGYAAHHGGKCILRYDDTNPEAEEQIYIDSILDIIRWLGFQPAEITYSSDYFGKLYELAEQLILIDKAYVCFCTGAEIKANRGGEERGPRKACAHRSLPVETSLSEFRKMKSGHYQPNEIILRMKQDLEDGNPQMWDLVAYRVLNASHHRTKDQWKIYPTYDFTHCLVDSFENISHSLCTTEFIQSRVSYEWLCHALNVYTPRQTEYGRLNLEGTVMSKRKIMRLVNEGHVEGWDDPRLYTLIALRRRGVPPEAILKFVNSLGVATAVSNIAIHRFEQTVRQHLELTTPRLMMVLKPIKVTIENLPDDHLELIDRPLHPKVPEMGSVRVPFTRVIYIERDDFSLIDSEDFFRLTPTRPVGLFQVPYPIKCKSWTTEPSSGLVTELICTYENERPVTKANKPKAYIHWIAQSEKLQSPVKVHETRIYKTLFKSSNPASHDDFLSDVDPNSLEVVNGCLLETGFWSVCERSMHGASLRIKGPEKAAVGLENVRFQGMRTAYFTLDKSSALSPASASDDCLPKNEHNLPRLYHHTSPMNRLVLNWIVSLKEDSGKKVG
ncbi:glutamine--tRNA ligase [Puccinia sorghi]|uniref:glutamine--tRNA ligase n=1 Tax=Puccinia sorghi TaxID=27349 RepID=A0A0L6VJL7_9BASI|nr:glutamine--tRNA ligase [Puccinia sorghi]